MANKTLKQLRDELLATPGVREAYEEQAPEFAIAQAIIAARTGAGLGQAETRHLSTCAVGSGDCRGEMTWTRQLPGPGRRAGRRRFLGRDRPCVSSAPVRFAIQAEPSQGLQARIRGWS